MWKLTKTRASLVTNRATSGSIIQSDNFQISILDKMTRMLISLNSFVFIPGGSQAPVKRRMDYIKIWLHSQTVSTVHQKLSTFGLMMILQQELASLFGKNMLYLWIIAHLVMLHSVLDHVMHRMEYTQMMEYVMATRCWREFVWKLMQYIQRIGLPTSSHLIRVAMRMEMLVTTYKLYQISYTSLSMYLLKLDLSMILTQCGPAQTITWEKTTLA